MCIISMKSVIPPTGKTTYGSDQTQVFYCLSVCVCVCPVVCCIIACIRSINAQLDLVMGVRAEALFAIDLLALKWIEFNRTCDRCRVIIAAFAFLGATKRWFFVKVFLKFFKERSLDQPVYYQTKIYFITIDGHLSAFMEE